MDSLLGLFHELISKFMAFKLHFALIYYVAYLCIYTNDTKGFATVFQTLIFAIVYDISANFF